MAKGSEGRAGVSKWGSSRSSWGSGGGSSKGEFVLAVEVWGILGWGSARAKGWKFFGVVGVERDSGGRGWASLLPGGAAICGTNFTREERGQRGRFGRGVFARGTLGCGGFGFGVGSFSGGSGFRFGLGWGSFGFEAGVGA